MDREDAPERMFPTSCDKKWPIALFPPKFSGQGFTLLNSTWNTGKGPTVKSKSLMEL